MAKREWVVNDKGALCLSGYPIRIERTPQTNIGSTFSLIEDQFRCLPYHTLAAAKMDGEKWADEIDALTPAENARVATYPNWNMMARTMQRRPFFAKGAEEEIEAALQESAGVSGQ